MERSFMILAIKLLFLINQDFHLIFFFQLKYIIIVKLYFVVKPQEK